MRDHVWRLFQWLTRNAPALHDAMAPGLMELAIDLYERDLETTFPANLRKLYHWRNGVYPDADGRIVARRSPIALGRAVKDPRDPAWHAALLPVFHGGGDDYVFWDRIGGELVERGHAIAPTFDEYLGAYVDSLEAGMWTVTADGLDDGGAFATLLATRWPGYPRPWTPPVIVAKSAPPPPPPPPEAKPYAPTTRYAVGDRVEHATFGTGTVRAVEPTKAVIEFAEGRRVLVHGRQRK